MRPKAYVITSGYGVNIFSGDPVKLTDNGVVELGTSDGTRNGTVGGFNLLGIFAGVQYRDSNARPVVSNYWPASTTGTEIQCYVYDDPETLFDVQYNNPSAGTTVQTAVGEECDWVVASPGGSTSTGLSNTLLGVIEAGTGQFQITGFGYGPDNVLTDAYVVATVRVNEHHYKASVASV
jgi:hypothetical protein